MRELKSSSIIVVEIHCLNRASDRMRKKIKDYAEIFGHVMRKLCGTLNNL